MRLKSFVLGAAGAVLLSACGPSGTYYEKTPEQVAAALRAAYLPTHVLGSTVTGSRVSQPDASTVVTALLDAEGRELMRFVTTVTPEGTGSRVSTDVRPPEGSHKERAVEAMEKNGFVMGLMGGLANEHVAAAIEGRPFDMMFANPVAKTMAGAVPGVKEQIDQANAGAMEMAKMERDAEFANEYGDAWGSSDAPSE
jgi:hypothetical protein